MIDMTPEQIDELIKFHEQSVEFGGAIAADTAQALRQLKMVTEERDRLIQLLSERDGGAHDADCKVNKGRGCTCGHDAVRRYLEANNQQGRGEE